MKKRSESRGIEPSRGVEAFVLAGARASGDALAETHAVPSKAHIKIAGTSMISRVLKALFNSKNTGKITVIGLSDHHKLLAEEAWPPATFRDGEDGPSSSVHRALNDAQMSAPVLVTTCDHALLTPAIIDTFVDATRATDADLTVALARREEIEARYPEVTRTYLKFGDGEYSSCNLFCLVTPAARQVVEFWRSAEQDRKRPWRIAWRFGVISAVRILVGRPGLEQVFAIVSRRLNVKIRPIVLPFADAAIDVDTPEDMVLVEQILLERTE